MQIQSEAKPYDDINITPMLDLAYVLLVIFIIMTTATVQGQKVNLPKAPAAPSLATQTTKAITVAHDGKRYRSLGDSDITNPVASTAANIDEILIELEQTRVPERAGRALDHETEDAFERLRVAGYL